MSGRHELDGFVYLGWFPWRFEKRTHCKVCRALAVGFCLVYGRGEPMLLLLCAECGPRAHRALYQPNAVGIRRRLTDSQRETIADTEGTSRQVGSRYAVSPTCVRKLRQERSRT